MPRRILKNKNKAVKDILKKFKTLEAFAEESGIHYDIVVNSLCGSNRVDDVLIESLIENGIHVEAVEE